MSSFLLTLLFSSYLMANIHPGFVSLSKVCPTLIIEASYSTGQNFTGNVVDGYKAQMAYLTKPAALALCNAQKRALEMGYSLKIFDGYRPIKAVSYFQNWAKKNEEEMSLKEKYYPHFTRLELFENGYIAKQSSHSRGSAVDLTLHDSRAGKDLDMGSIFDYFDDISNTNSQLITDLQKENRFLLKELMESHGFKNYAKEWWHYQYRQEPYPNASFDFDVE